MLLLLLLLLIFLCSFTCVHPLLSKIYTYRIWKVLNFISELNVKKNVSQGLWQEKYELCHCNTTAI
jgi:hypothetical protein